MITEKSKISKNFPIMIEFFFQFNNMYLFPQGYTCCNSIAKKMYDGKKSRQGETVFKNQYYTLYEQYYFRWLCLCIIFTVRLSKGTTQYIIEKNYNPPAQGVVICENCKRFHLKEVKTCACGSSTFRDTHPSNIKHIIQNKPVQ